MTTTYFRMRIAGLPVLVLVMYGYSLIIYLTARPSMHIIQLLEYIAKIYLVAVQAHLRATSR